MSSSSETEVMAVPPTQNGDSHSQSGAVRPEVSDNADESSPANEQAPEKTSKITEKTSKKAEVKPAKSNKKLKEEEKKLKLLMKSFEDIENPEAKLDALGKKHLQLTTEHKTTEARKDELEKRLEKVVKERDQLQSEFNKASLAKNKLESLCRELQRHSKLVKEESQLRSQEEEAKRKELSEKFQTTINDISEQMQENYKANQQLKTENNELAARLKGLVEQYEVREEHVEKVFKHKQLELQLAEAKMAQQNLQFNEDKEKTLSENQLLIKQAQEYKKQCEILTKQEAEMKSQLAMYAERFEEFQKTLNKSNEVFSTFKKEMDKMTKTIKKLEKEKLTWKTKCENGNRSLVQMVDEREKQKNEMAALRLKNEKLENLCRALHKGAKVTAGDIDQTKETSSANSDKEIESSSGKERIRDENEQSTSAAEISSKHTLEASEDVTGEENKNHSEEQHSKDSDGDSSNGVQEPGAENSNEFDDSPTDSETTPTVPADTPRNSEEVPAESEKVSSTETASVVNDESTSPDVVDS
ncbi:beta-taxilin-like [Oculina patagonica]